MPGQQRVARSLQLYQRAGALIPGRTQLISRRSSQFAHGNSPIYAARAKGARFIDVDENEYIDWVNAVGAVILGHADPSVDSAVKEQIDRGSIFTLNSALEIELAELLNDVIPSAEMARYTKGGGEANALAARIARGTTNRNLILFCGYHGWHDWYQSANYLVDPASGEFPFAGIEPIGVPPELAGTALPFAWGGIDGLRDLLEAHVGEVAAIMMEPMRSEMPPPGYLEDVQRLARAHGAVLIFDEVSCGFRPRIGGVQEYLGIKPDMTVLAKAMSNGYPMGAVVGSRAVMEPASRMFISSSYWSDNLGLTASLSTIRELQRRNSAQRFEVIGTLLITKMNQALREAGLAGACGGVFWNPVIQLDLPDESLRAAANTIFIQEMARRGIHCNMSFKATLEHSEADIERTATCAGEVFAMIQAGLASGDLLALLESDLKKEPFRRLVR
ncbi:MAG: aminotransferase class III-fold pyridoxal phosphate-dependent enzyme [Chloroflexi bacterium]|nr:aminotransferase class III-fold pyridoxal phosphate-dependent enzyme [Chloroflexota bacterium]MCY3581397.1 aminotransferase class III-fold pyridoxal phosphate-dependent enzyme [Chloroflexota bacterium]MCY3717542.1 aminotransferase class III-fold pyridoxal phosphate-dependent enzyme [Chloroflexota bacterium]MDE2651949.1 aminotransferase class III-fold pyridoxal phosphate-dependent enzyme [Chloroflexota bacterium]MXX51452.1 aminotransferase class III-fold pyridoxal phosphate-dependent enzyme [